MHKVIATHFLCLVDFFCHQVLERIPNCFGDDLGRFKQAAAMYLHYPLALHHVEFEKSTFLELPNEPTRHPSKEVLTAIQTLWHAHFSKEVPLPADIDTLIQTQETLPFADGLVEIAKKPADYDMESVNAYLRSPHHTQNTTPAEYLANFQRRFDIGWFDKTPSTQAYVQFAILITIQNYYRRIPLSTESLNNCWFGMAIKDHSKLILCLVDTFRGLYEKNEKFKTFMETHLEHPDVLPFSQALHEKLGTSTLPLAYLLPLLEEGGVLFQKTTGGFSQPCPRTAGIVSLFKSPAYLRQYFLRSQPEDLLHFLNVYLKESDVKSLNALIPILPPTVMSHQALFTRLLVLAKTYSSLAHNLTDALVNNPIQGHTIAAIECQFHFNYAHEQDGYAITVVQRLAAILPRCPQIFQDLVPKLSDEPSETFLHFCWEIRNHLPETAVDAIACFNQIVRPPLLVHSAQHMIQENNDELIQRFSHVMFEGVMSNELGACATALMTTDLDSFKQALFSLRNPQVLYLLGSSLMTKPHHPKTGLFLSHLRALCTPNTPMYQADAQDLILSLCTLAFSSNNDLDTIKLFLFTFFDLLNKSHIDTVIGTLHSKLLSISLEQLQEMRPSAHLCPLMTPPKLRDYFGEKLRAFTLNFLRLSTPTFSDDDLMRNYPRNHFNHPFYFQAYTLQRLTFAILSHKIADLDDILMRGDFDFDDAFIAAITQEGHHISAEPIKTLNAFFNDFPPDLHGRFPAGFEQAKTAFKKRFFPSPPATPYQN